MQLKLLYTHCIVPKLSLYVMFILPQPALKVNGISLGQCTQSLVARTVHWEELDGEGSGFSPPHSQVHQRIFLWFCYKVYLDALSFLVYSQVNQLFTYYLILLDLYHIWLSPSTAESRPSGSKMTHCYVIGNKILPDQ